MRKTHYHITSLENRESILEKGLISDSGAIFTFTDIRVASQIALNQLGLREYCVFEVDSKGFHTPPVNDDVAELTARHQWIIQQKHIEPKFVKFLGQRQDNPFDVWEKHQRELARMFGINEEEFIMPMIRIDAEWLQHYNKKYNLKLTLLKSKWTKFEGN